MRSTRWVCTRISNVSTCDIQITLGAAYLRCHRVPACHCVGGYTLTTSPSLFLFPSLLPSGPTSPVSSFLGHEYWGGTPLLDHERAAATSKIVARQRLLCLSSCSPLPAPCAARTSHPASHPHNTLACNHTSLPPPPLPHRHLIAISILAINCLSRARRWASSQQPLRTEPPSTSTQPTPVTPANTHPPHALAKHTKEPWLYPPSSLTNERSSVGHAQAPHRLTCRW